MCKSKEDNTNIQNQSNNRKRKTLRFTLPYKMAVATKRGSEFFKILGKIFPKMSNLSKIIY